MIEVEASGQACGARVTGLDLRRPLEQGTIRAIRAAWLEHKVLSFPDQPISDDDLERFTRYFGPFGEDPFFEAIDGHPNIAAIHRTAEEVTSLFADNWHADWSFQERPPDGTCLHGRIIPSAGGDTLFADQQAALAAMPLELRGRIEGKIGIHSARIPYAPDGTYGLEDEKSGRSMRIVPSDDAYATQRHPLIRLHPETGGETLYSTMGYIVGIEGMDDADGRDLLIEVQTWQSRPEFVYRHHWETNMLVMWDNRCILHKATGGYEGHERLLHRTTIGWNPEVRR